MTDLPSFLPDTLDYCSKCTDENDLFQTLAKNATDLVEFFEIATEDEGWMDLHPHLIKRLTRWCAKAFYTNQLARPLARRIVNAIQEHSSFFESFLFFRPSLFNAVTLTVQGKEHIVNSLMFGTASSYFHYAFKSHCFEKWNDQWTIQNCPSALFLLIHEHIHKGKIDGLWRHEQPEVLALMEQAKRFELTDLMKECSDILKRYIDRNNVIDTLLEAYKKGYFSWEQDCRDVANKQGWGLAFPTGKEGDFWVEVLDDRLDTLQLFEKVSPYITHLAFHGNLSEGELYGELVKKCPRLIGADLSDTNMYAYQFNALPTSLTELRLSSCLWLNPDHLKFIASRFPSLKELHLAGNTHLTSAFWGELSNLGQVVLLDLTNCSLTDADIKIIAGASPQLVEVILEGCKNVTDEGISELIHSCFHLAFLNLNRMGITDKTMTELGNHAYCLTHISLIRCPLLSDQGLLQLVNLRRTLKFLNIQQSPFSLRTIEKIRHNFPLLEIIS